MAKANTAKFSQYVLEVEFDPGRNPNTFTKVCGLVSRGMNRQHNMAVTAVPDCADENLPSQNQRSVDSSDVSISGIGVYARQSHQKMLDWWYGGHTLNVRIKHVKAIRGETEYESGPAYLVSLNETAEKSAGAVTSELSIEFDGVPTRTAKQG